jgi:cytochrome c
MRILITVAKTGRRREKSGRLMAGILSNYPTEQSSETGVIQALEVIQNAKIEFGLNSKAFNIDQKELQPCQRGKSMVCF